jgi:hypothetical protein
VRRAELEAGGVNEDDGERMHGTTPARRAAICTELVCYNTIVIFLSCKVASRFFIKTYTNGVYFRRSHRKRPNGENGSPFHKNGLKIMTFYKKYTILSARVTFM